jgi:hypothetical protein
MAGAHQLRPRIARADQRHGNAALALAGGAGPVDRREMAEARYHPPCWRSRRLRSHHSSRFSDLALEAAFEGR